METIFLNNILTINCGYTPSHCWYYKFNPPLSAQRIIDLQRNEIEVTLPKIFDKLKFIKIAEEVSKDLYISIERYLHVCVEDYMTMPWETSIKDKVMGKCTALSLTHNHISYYAGQLNYIMRIAKENNLKFDIKL
jgi:hypothetical protein